MLSPLAQHVIRGCPDRPDGALGALGHRAPTSYSFSPSVGRAHRRRTPSLGSSPARRASASAPHATRRVAAGSSHASERSVTYQVLADGLALQSTGIRA